MSSFCIICHIIIVAIRGVGLVMVRQPRPHDGDRPMFFSLLLLLVIRRASRTRRGLGLEEGGVLLGLGAVKALVEDRLELVDLELGLQVLEMVRQVAAVGATTSIGEVEVLVHDLLAGRTPVCLAATVLLGLLWVDAVEAVLGEELRDVVMREGRALSNAGVVLVIELVRSSHLGEDGEMNG